VTHVKNDAAVVALTLNEAWSCATPKAIRSLLGWSAVAPTDLGSGEVGGVSIVARYGLAGSSTRLALPRCDSTSEQYWAVQAPVYADSARTRVVHVFATHWKGCAVEGPAMLNFMQKYAYKPRAMMGDLNSKSPSLSQVVALKNGGFSDVWAKLRGSQPGHTSSWNNASGSPKGSPYKRIDYAFTKSLKAVGISLFNNTGTPGTAKPADHLGVKVEYAW
jgi:hypothetical protein